VLMILTNPDPGLQASRRLHNAGLHQIRICHWLLMSVSLKKLKLLAVLVSQLYVTVSTLLSIICMLLEPCDYEGNCWLVFQCADFICERETQGWYIALWSMDVDSTDSSGLFLIIL
jgi:hypothetical protein